MAVSAKTIGVLRFSVLSPTFYTDELGSVEAVAAHIFSPDRLELRFHLFEKLCLPSLVSQTDQEFDMVILTAEALPAPWMERLEDLLAPHPNLHLLKAAPDNHYRLIQRAYATIPTGESTHLFQFRLDDDDALDRDFVARTKRLAHGLLAFQDPGMPFIIAHGRGFYVIRGEGGNEVFDSTERAPLSAGTTLVAPVGYGRNPYRYVHRKLLQHYTTYSDISVPAYIRTVHGDNKSETPRMGIVGRWRPRLLDRQLRQHFGITLDELRAL